MIVVIDYDMGNAGSIVNMLKTIGAEAIISSDFKEIEQADRLILPGVGAFDKAMSNLEELGIIPLLKQRVVEEKIPLLGICLGMQLLANSSEEGKKRGLGWIEGEVKKFNFKGAQFHLKVPHMGWNFITTLRASPILTGLEKDARFYFVHSYHFVCRDREDDLGQTDYGYQFTSAVQRDNIVGVQFHPEKSHKYGMRLLENFANFN